MGAPHFAGCLGAIEPFQPAKASIDIHGLTYIGFSHRLALKGGI
jgi:hypothetical protein